MTIVRLAKLAYSAILQAKLIENWRKKNRHNYTVVGNYFDISHVTVGKKTYGEINAFIHNPDYFLTIGSYCSIAPNVVFLLSSDHNMECISTYPLKVKCANCVSYEAISKGDIIVDDDVWIGYGAIIMSGVHIHQGAVIAAGAVVTKDVDPYAIVGGVPAKLIKYRFSGPIIEKLVNIDFQKINDELVTNNLEKFYSEINEDTVLDWLPSRS